LENKITYNSDRSKRANKSNPHPNETYYSRLKQTNGEMKAFDISEKGHYLVFKLKEEKPNKCL